MTDSGAASSQLVDWGVAAATAKRLAPPGPAVGAGAARDAVDDLRALAVEAEDHVARFTGLVSGAEAEPVAVVDRPAWIDSNITGFRVVLDPLAGRLVEQRAARPGGAFVTAVGSRVTGVQTGAILAYLATKVLGQYEVFLPPGQGDGRLTLVAPNIVAVEQTLQAEPRDFRLWVCLHEVTHRTQFTAVPWLRQHLQDEVSAFINATDLDPAAMAARLRAAAGAIADSLRGKGTVSLLEVVQSPEQRAVLDRLTALMTLLEGHAQYVMDGVGPDVVPSVAEIRRRFDRRRDDVRGLERVLRRLLGMEMKLRQYAEGDRFVAAVVRRAGMSGFNRIWESPETLPSKAEIADADAWVARVHGLPATA